MRALASNVLMAAGLLLVLGGLGTALDFSAAGLVASIAAVAALLYAGAVLGAARSPSGAAAREAVVVFDSRLRIVSGLRRGEPLATLFPPALHADLQAKCGEALSGQPARLRVVAGRRDEDLDVLPVRAADGRVAFGVLAVSCTDGLVGAGRV